MHTNADLLLVEDNPNDVELVVHALRRQAFPHSIYVVHDGVEALDYIFATGAYSQRRIENAPRVILLDLKLPKLDGLEVLRRIKADPRTRTIPVVMLTSSSEERDLSASYQSGVNSYIVKPVDSEKYNTAIMELGLYWLTLNQTQ